MTQKHIEWAGVEDPSFEKCILTYADAGITAQSAIVGKQADKSYRAEYIIELEQNWLVKSVKIHVYLQDKQDRIAYETDTNGNWTKDGQPAPEFDGCRYIDIFPTPFTNSLPINHPGMQVGESTVMKVLYIDIPAEEVTVRQQRYTRLSENSYRFENIPNDFEAVITVDEDGLVTDYPGLFVMV